MAEDKKTENKETEGNDLQKQLIFFDSLQKQLQVILEQKQMLEIENLQSNAALAELEKADGKIFKAVGSVLIETNSKKMIEELNERLEKNKGRSEKMKKQEEMVKMKMTETQKKIESQLPKQQNP